MPNTTTLLHCKYTTTNYQLPLQPTTNCHYYQLLTTSNRYNQPLLLPTTTTNCHYYPLPLLPTTTTTNYPYYYQLPTANYHYHYYYQLPTTTATTNTDTTTTIATAISSTTSRVFCAMICSNCLNL